MATVRPNYLDSPRAVICHIETDNGVRVRERRIGHILGEKLAEQAIGTGIL
ncbi:hypothetical protein [Hoyosella subflava]|uniref:Uncharacterized protein n=1 Tax=Hoyosella subflava (strain DSM 45089 / JCM 17490 / NBRC 109087 / DQS3-9A1) TaxID=443218 RepID=F6EH32_HOYSD|nr:hypothetical protein [Hoyosella subflava]AEF39869.1 hypothetical protein AS9A_1417 [Hoyosella subflava DQS3-9A1]